MEHQDPVNLVDISHLKRIKGTRSNSTPLVIKLMSLIKTDKSNTIRNEVNKLQDGALQQPNFVDVTKG
jgi:hypothetical protein